MDSKEIKKYWEERAAENQGLVTGTTNDIYLRELEIRTFISKLKSLGVKDGDRILDLGCGDGYSTLQIAKELENVVVIGVDFSKNMIKNAESNLSNSEVPPSKLSFQVADAVKISDFFDAGTFQFVLSDRCLINLGNSETQYQTIKQVSDLLTSGGHYLGIENFKDGQDNLNKARVHMKLEEIGVRWHNHFFKEDEFLNSVQQWFEEVQISNFSSAYYYATRVIYSAVCKLNNVDPDYTDDIHKVSIDLPACGNFSPIKLFVLKK